MAYACPIFPELARCSPLYCVCIGVKRAHTCSMRFSIDVDPRITVPLTPCEVLSSQVAAVCCPDTSSEMRTLTLRETAEFHKTTEDTVSHAIRAKGLPAARVGRAYVLVDVDVIEWLRGQYVATHEDEAGCGSTSAAMLTTGGSNSAIAGDKLERALERRTARQRRSTPIESKPISGGKPI